MTWSAFSKNDELRMTNAELKLVTRHSSLVIACIVVLFFCLWCGDVAGPAWSAQTQPSLVTSKTELVVKLATDEVVPVRSRFHDDPPTIVIEFPPGRVVGVLPERSMIQRGVIQAISASYAPAGRKSVEARRIQQLNIQLRSHHLFHVRTERGRIVVEIEHPAEVTSEAVEVGLAGGTVIVGARPPLLSERFRAMQDALDQAHPLPWMWQASAAPAAPVGLTNTSSLTVSSSTAPPPASPSRTPVNPQRSPFSQGAAVSWWWIVGGGIGLAAAGLVWLRQRSRALAAGRAMRNPPLQLPSAIHVIDQLVWRAFERQGYQLLHMAELPEPLGVMRTVVKEGVNTALLVVGEGRVLEKTLVEQFFRVMHAVSVEPQGHAGGTLPPRPSWGDTPPTRTNASVAPGGVERGILVAAGSFTIPAQCCAKEHGIILIGRDQLTELLSDGVMNEYATKQLQQLQGQLDEATNTLSQYTQQLDVLRRQRNEASWFLGEERAQTAKLQAHVSELQQQIQQWQTQAEQWEQTAQRTRTQWEENEWYLGESRAVARHLEEQIITTQASCAQLEERHRTLTAALQDTYRHRQESEWYLGESRAAQESLRQHVEQLTGQLLDAQNRLAQMQRSLEDAQRHLQEEQDARRLLEAEREALRTYGERRRALRVSREDMLIEVQRPDDGAMVFRGSPLNLSRTGLGFEIQQPLDGLPDPLTIRLVLPGWERPIHATSRVVWQRHDPVTQNRLVGCELIEMPAESRQAFEQLFASR